MLCGSRSDSAIAEWGLNYGAQLAQALGLTRTPPCAATLHTVLRRRDREVLEAKLGAWAEGLWTETPAPDGGSCTCSLRIHTAGSPVDHHRIKKFYKRGLS